MISAQLPAAVQAEHYTGVAEAAAAAVACALWAGRGAEAASAHRPARVTVLLCRNLPELEGFAAGFAFFADGGGAPASIRMLPDVQELDADDPRHFERQCDLLSALSALQAVSADSSAPPLVLGATPQTLLQPTPTRSGLSESQITIQRGEQLDFATFVDRLGSELGYANEVVCESPGQFAVRGGLVDIYPLNAPAPVRVDFFGDEIESLREFDPTTQRTERELDSMVLVAAEPLGEFEATPWGGARRQTLLEHLPPGVSWFLHEPARLVRTAPEVFQYPERIAAPSHSFKHVLDARADAGDRWVGLSAFESEGGGIFGSEADTYEVVSESLDAYRPFADADKLGLARTESEHQAREQFFAQLRTWCDEGYDLHWVTTAAGESDRLREVLNESEHGKILTRARFHEGSLTDGFRLDASLNFQIEEDHRDGKTVGPDLVSGPPDAQALGERQKDSDANDEPDAQRPGPRSGPTIGLRHRQIWVTSAEVFGRKKVQLGVRRRRQVERRAVDDALDFADLADGDYLVHLTHGICRYRGMQRLELSEGQSEEVISLEFADSVTLHLKLHDSHLLSRYVGLTKATPKLGKLGSSGFKKTRAAAEKATLDFAAHLLRLQAERDAQPGHPFAPDHELQRQFESAFPFTETRDQLTAIQDTKHDMERERPMDRLLCGDVGFGKTEVALRAALKAALDGKQCAVLVPTTVLCQQHFNTFRERFADTPVVVEMLSSFRTGKQKTEILRQLKNGSIDVLVGTHSLLGKGV
ncbi:MAG: DEAD/DEAH box helicase, partial [Opitutales bacterium]